MISLSFLNLAGDVMFSFFLPNSKCKLIDPREKSNDRNQYLQDRFSQGQKGPPTVVSSAPGSAGCGKGRRLPPAHADSGRWGRARRRRRLYPVLEPEPQAQH